MVMVKLMSTNTRAGLAMGFGFVDGATDLVNWGLNTAMRGLPDTLQILSLMLMRINSCKLPVSMVRFRTSGAVVEL